MSRHVSEKIVSRLHVTCSTKELFSRCTENYSATLRPQSFSVLRQFFPRSSRKMGRKEQEDRKRKAAAKSCQSMDTDCLDRKVLSEKIPRLQKFIGKTLKVNVRFRDYCLVKYCVNTNCKIFYFSEPRNGTSPAERN